MFSRSYSMRNNTFRSAQAGASCDATDGALLGGRALAVRLFDLPVIYAIWGLLLGLLISPFKLMPLRIS